MVSGRHLAATRPAEHTFSFERGQLDLEVRNIPCDRLQPLGDLFRLSLGRKKMTLPFQEP